MGYVYNDRGGEFEPLPAGEYTLELVDIAAVPGKLPTQWRAKFQELETGKHVKNTFTLSEKAGWVVDAWLKASGIAPNKGEEVKLDRAKFIGSRCYARIIQEKFVSNQTGAEMVGNKIAKFIIKAEPPQRAAVIEAADMPATEKAKDEIPF